MPVSALLTAPPGTWVHQAACGGRWDVMEATDEQTAQDAKGLCRHACPVLAKCRTWVLSLPPSADVYGICAGMTADERRKARRNTRRRVQPCDDTPDDHKPCSNCKEVKPLTEYYQDDRAADGRQSQCQVCHRETVMSGARSRKAAEATA